MKDRKTSIQGMSRMEAAFQLTGSKRGANEVLHIIDTCELDPEYDDEVTYTGHIKNNI